MTINPNNLSVRVARPAHDFRQQVSRPVYKRLEAVGVAAGLHRKAVQGDLKDIRKAAGNPRAALITPVEFKNLVIKYDIGVTESQLRSLGQTLLAALGDKTSESIDVPLVPAISMDVPGTEGERRILNVANSPAVIAERQIVRNAIYGFLGLDNPWLDQSLPAAENPDRGVWYDDAYVTGVTFGRSGSQFQHHILDTAQTLLNTGFEGVPETVTLLQVSLGHQLRG